MSQTQVEYSKGFLSTHVGAPPQNSGGQTWKMSLRKAVWLESTKVNDETFWTKKKKKKRKKKLFSHVICAGGGGQDMDADIAIMWRVFNSPHV